MKQAVSHWISSCSKQLLDLAGRIGVAMGDSDETALRKRVAIALFAGTLPFTIAWSVIYLAAVAPLAAAIPGFYSVFTPINTFIFARTRNLEVYRFTQLLFVLILAWLVMMALGGFQPSSAVILWATLSPLGSPLLDDLRRTLFWIAGFVALLIAGALLEPYLSPPALPETFVRWFFVLNLGMVTIIIFGLLYYFVDRRNFFQERSEMLLLNILPKEISEILKARPRAIADQFPADACIRGQASGRRRFHIAFRRTALVVGFARSE